MLKLQRINMPKISLIVRFIKISLFIFLLKKIVEYCKVVDFIIYFLFKKIVEYCKVVEYCVWDYYIIFQFLRLLKVYKDNVVE